MFVFRIGVVVSLVFAILGPGAQAAKNSRQPRETRIAKDSIAPAIDSFVVPSVSSSLIVSPITLVASDNKGVTGYILRENSAVPASTSTWLSTAPTGYSFSSPGEKTLWAWVRDAAGNVSVGRSASVTIVLPAPSPTPSPTPTPTPTPSATVTATPVPTVSVDRTGSWQQNLDNVFDIVETFDQLQAWRGRCGGNFYGKTSTPKQLDGSESIWTYYSCWGSTASTGPAWIDDFGTGTRITGKSLVVDMGTAQKGPSRLGLYFGNGAADSGYDDLYLFYRVRFPANEWPTRIDSTTRVGEFFAGDPYVYWASWKFGALNLGCTGMNANLQCDGAEPYSAMHLVPHIKRYGYGAMTGKLAIVQEPTGLTPFWATGKEIQTEKWLGVEFHYKLARGVAQNTVTMETWLYDEDGTAHLAQAPVTHAYTPTVPNEKFNFYFLGGNNSGSYLWGATMESAYHVDDFIINASRIGPTYFQMARQLLAP